LELELVEVICRCGLTFKVNKGNKQVWHSIACRDFYADKALTDASRAWRRTNAKIYRDNKRKKKCLKES